MRHKRKIISILLMCMLLVMSFAGCKDTDLKKEQGSITEQEQKDGDDDGNVKIGTGRFLENEVTLPAEVSQVETIRKLSDGSLGAIGVNPDDGTCYLMKTSDLAVNWDLRKIDGIDVKAISQYALAPDGSAMLIGYSKGETVEAYAVDADAKAKELSVQIPAAKSDGNQILQAAFDNTGYLIVRDMEGTLLEVNLSDGTCSAFLDTGGISVNYFCLSGNLLLAVHNDGVLLFDTKEKKEEQSESILDELIKKNVKWRSVDTDSGIPMIFSEGTKEGAIVLANQEGVFHFTRGGSVLEQMIDGSLTSLGAGDDVFNGLEMMDEENIFLVFQDGKGQKLFHYVYDKDAAAAPSRELTVYALDESAALRQAVTLFQKNHPDISVKLETGLSGDDGVTLKDALSVLNTNILAKKGPDVLVMDGMPVESYIEKGVLADISDVVEEVDKEDGIFSNIKEQSKKDGKIYAMPARFMVSVVEGDQETVKAGSSLAALAKRGEELKKNGGTKNVMQTNKGTQTFLRDLAYADSANWLTESGSLDQNALTEFLTNAKGIYDIDSASKDEDYRNEAIGDGTVQGSKVETHNSAGLISKEYQIAYGSITSWDDIQTMCSTWTQTKMDYGILNDEKSKSYIPYLTVGVMEGDHIEEAKQFLKEFLGKEASMDTNGFPVNRAAYDALAEEKLDDPEVKNGVSIGFGSSDGDAQYGFEYVNLQQSDIDKFTGIVESLEKPALTDRTIQELVLEQGDKYLLGEQSLESTVDTIMKKVNLYLAE